MSIFIDSNTKGPFFLYLPHTMVHLPLAVSKAFDNPDKELITNAIEEVDWSVGEVLKSVKAAGIADNTLVIFTSDHGSSEPGATEITSIAKSEFTVAAAIPIGSPFVGA